MKDQNSAWVFQIRFNACIGFLSRHLYALCTANFVFSALCDAKRALSIPSPLVRFKQIRRYIYMPSVHTVDLLAQVKNESFVGGRRRNLAFF